MSKRTYAEWIAEVEKIRYQYLEGAITEREYFIAVVARAGEVEDAPENRYLTLGIEG